MACTCRLAEFYQKYGTVRRLMPWQVEDGAGGAASSSWQQSSWGASGGGRSSGHQ